MKKRDSPSRQVAIDLILRTFMNTSGFTEMEPKNWDAISRWGVYNLAYWFTVLLMLIHFNTGTDLLTVGEAPWYNSQKIEIAYDSVYSTSDGEKMCCQGNFTILQESILSTVHIVMDSQIQHFIQKVKNTEALWISSQQLCEQQEVLRL